MLNNSDIVQRTILRQREALYQIHNEFGIARTDLEVLGYAKEKMFFTSYDLQEYYIHTNIQQIRRSLRNLTASNFIKVFSKTQEKKRVYYVISSKGKQAYYQYEAIILN